ncbi:MAG: 3-phosphoshikimate 1-carboxyvinyltransferase, partial [Peptococcaceae bacterium]|nr:3-phosphoshikimate 1-carboxyvinyltransferase [Peptococcaceae bacterium]
MRASISKLKGLKGIMEVPGDKSISHRALMMGSLAEGQTLIENFLPGEDCLATLSCFSEMGVSFQGPDNGRVIIEGVGLNGLQEPQKILNAENSGTTMRLLSGILAGQDFFSVITGDKSLNSRPMARIIEPLSQMGAFILGRGGNSFAPLAIRGGNLKAISYSSPVASAQVKSAILLAGLFAKGWTYVSEPTKSRDHTERMLEYMGVEISVQENKVGVLGGGRLLGSHIKVPGDISSAAFFMVAAAITPNSDLTINNVGINPTRDGIIEALKSMGADIQIH